MIHNCLLDGDFLAEPLQWIFSLKLFELGGCVLIQELIERKVAAANSDLDIIFLDFDCYSLGAELVYAFGLAHEHDLQLLSLGVVIDELGEFAIDWVLSYWNVDGNSLLEVNDVLLESVDLQLRIFELLQ